MGDETARSGCNCSTSTIIDGYGVVPRLSVRSEQVLARREQWYRDNGCPYYSMGTEVTSEIKSEPESEGELAIKSEPESEKEEWEEGESAEEESEASGSRSTRLPGMNVFPASTQRMYPTVKKEIKSEVLRKACIEGDEDVVGKLLAEGQSIHEAFPGGKRAIHIACERGHSSLVQKLLKQKANVNDRGYYGDEHTPLMLAAASGYTGIVRMLLNHGAIVNAENTTDGSTALVYACMGGHVTAAKLLLEHGANIKSFNRTGNMQVWKTLNGVNALRANEQGLEEMNRQR